MNKHQILVWYKQIEEIFNRVILKNLIFNQKQMIEIHNDKIRSKLHLKIKKLGHPEVKL